MRKLTLTGVDRGFLSHESCSRRPKLNLAVPAYVDKVTSVERDEVSDLHFHVID